MTAKTADIEHIQEDFTAGVLHMTGMGVTICHMEQNATQLHQNTQTIVIHRFWLQPIQLFEGYLAQLTTDAKNAKKSHFFALEAQIRITPKPRNPDLSNRHPLICKNQN